MKALAFYLLLGLGNAYSFEQQTIGRSKDGSFITVLSFTQTLIVDARAEYQNLDTFPPLLFDIAKSNKDLLELNVSLTRGRWPNIQDTDFFKPTGLAVSLIDKDSGNLKRILNQLSGILCVSSNLISDNIVAKALDSNHMLYQGQLPLETSCTENLTPWLKLLPCANKAGLASLLDYKVQQSHYLALMTEISKFCSNGYSNSDCSSFELKSNMKIVMHSSESNLYDSFKAPNSTCQALEKRPTLELDTRILNPDVNSAFIINSHSSGLFYISVTTQESFKFTQQIPNWIKLFPSTLDSRSCDGIPVESPRIIYFNGRIEVISEASVFKCRLITIKIERIILKYKEYPPDANKPFPIESAQIMTKTLLYSPISSVFIANPDFSMPYNVITFTCTVIALMYSSFYNTVMKTLKVETRTR